MEITVSLGDDGTLTFMDSSGNPIAEHLVELAKKQQGDKIKVLIQGKCDEINSQIESLGKFHEYTTPPRPHAFEQKAFDEPSPVSPPDKIPSFFCRLFKSCIARVKNENQLAREKHEANVHSWEQRKRAHNEDQRKEKEFLSRLNDGDAKAMEEWFETVLQDIVWPQETLVAFEMPSPRVVAVDIDLPEIESMPDKTATVPQRGFKLSVKEMGPTQVQKLYMRHVHAVGFRIAGEAFAVSPSVETVVLSAYSQRPDRATGKVRDEYLYSVRIPRNKWLAIDFNNLANLDPVEAFTKFDFRREMSKTGVFKPIEPHSI